MKAQVRRGNAFLLALSLLGGLSLAFAQAAPAVTSGPANNRVFGWGLNSDGQLGDGTAQNRSSPARARELKEVFQVAAGKSAHSLAVKPDGTVWAWGANGDGQLGNGTLNNSSVPVQATGLTGITAVSAGFSHSLALKDDGMVWAWGSNIKGQLGGTDLAGADDPLYATTCCKLKSPVPVPVAGLSGITSIAAGGLFSVALDSSGQVWAWGDDSQGQLGDGRKQYTAEPSKVNGLPAQIKAIAAGAYFNLAIDGGGNLWAWGDNSKGQAAKSDGTQALTAPWQVPNMVGVTSISAGSDHALAVKSDNTVWSWGDNSGGQLGDPSLDPQPSSFRAEPAQVQGLPPAASISGGYKHSLALTEDGDIWSWGNNAKGQLGNATSADGLSPSRVGGPAKSISAGGDHSLAIASADADFPGQVRTYGWGGNGQGTLGDGTTEGKLKPNQLLDPSSLKDVAAGNRHSLGLDADGKVWAWGSNTFGQLGNGTTTSSALPVKVAGLDNVVAISAGNAHSLALKADGTVWAWGDNSRSQIGFATVPGFVPFAGFTAVGTPINPVPVPIPELSGITAVAAGWDHSLALKSNGTVWSWGWNNEGELGLGSGGNVQISSAEPKVIPGLQNVKGIAAGRFHSLAVNQEGHVFGWGGNANGQAGEGDNYFLDRWTPYQIPSLEGMAVVSAGASHSLALSSHGTVWSWGRNSAGQLGRTPLGETNVTPEEISGLSDVASVSGGSEHTLARTASGVAYAWGSNTDGQLGNDTTVASPQPTPVPDFGAANVISAGSNYSLAIASNKNPLKGLPAIAVGNVSVQEGDEGTTEATLSVSLSGSPSTEPTTVRYATEDGTAKAPDDYVSAQGHLVFQPGETTRKIILQVKGDTAKENKESFLVVLSNPQHGVISDGVGRVDIIDDDASESALSIGDVSLDEGNSGTTDARFTVTLSRSPGPAGVKVDYATSDGKARSASDYAATNGTLTFSAGQAVQTIAVPVDGDGIAEPDEAFFMNLSNPVNASIADGQGKATIRDDDGYANSLPSIAIHDRSFQERVTENDPCPQAGTDAPNKGCLPWFEVTLSKRPAQTVTMKYATSDGSATSPDDYDASAGIVTFKPNDPADGDGIIRKRVDLTVHDDNLVEGSEDLFVTLSDAANATIDDGEARLVILDDDVDGENNSAAPTLRINNVTVSEPDSGTADAVFMASLSKASAKEVSARFATQNDTALAGPDYVSTAGKVTFAAGETWKAIRVPVVGDTVEENVEEFKVTLSDPVNIEIGRREGTGTIDDNDGASPHRSAGGAFITGHRPEEVLAREFEPGQGDAVTVINFMRAAVRYVTHGKARPSLLYVSEDETAKYIRRAGRDFGNDFNNTTVADAVPGNSSNVDLSTVDFSKYDAVIVGCTGAPGQACQVTQRELNVLMARRGDVVRYINAGGGWVGFDESNYPTPFGYFPSIKATNEDSTDWCPGSGKFNDGNCANATYSVSPAGEGMSITDSAVNHFGWTGHEFVKTGDWDVVDIIDTPAGSHGIPVTLAKQDPIVGAGIFIEDQTVKEGNSGTTRAVARVILPEPAKSAVRVDYQTSSGAAEKDKDFRDTRGTLVFNQGETAQTITVPVIGDTLVEPDEDLRLTLSNAVGTDIERAVGKIKILNDDSVKVNINSVKVKEGDAGTADAVFKVSLDGGTIDSPLKVQYQITDGTATAGLDYVNSTALDSSLGGNRNFLDPVLGSKAYTFPRNATGTNAVWEIHVPVIGDKLIEGDETFKVAVSLVSPPPLVEINEGVGTGTIVDDDALPALPGLFSGAPGNGDSKKDPPTGDGFKQPVTQPGAQPEVAPGPAVQPQAQLQAQAQSQVQSQAQGSTQAQTAQSQAQAPAPSQVQQQVQQQLQSQQQVQAQTVAQAQAGVAMQRRSERQAEKARIGPSGAKSSTWLASARSTPSPMAPIAIGLAGILTAMGVALRSASSRKPSVVPLRRSNLPNRSSPRTVSSRRPRRGD